MATAVIDTNKMSKLGLRRKPTYDEIIGMIDDNDKITGKLPNRDATFFKSSPEGSFFDGSDAMEQLRKEQGKLLLRQMSDILLSRRKITTTTFTITSHRTTNSTNGCRRRTNNPSNNSIIKHSTSITTTSRTDTKRRQGNEKKRGNSDKSQRRSIQTEQAHNH